jgi:hypothetical protein
MNGGVIPLLYRLNYKEEAAIWNLEICNSFLVPILLINPTKREEGGEIDVDLLPTLHTIYTKLTN